MAKRRHRARLIRTRLAAFLGFLLIAALALVAAPQPATAAGPVLLSQGKPATASSTENTGTPASGAVDGDTGTRWSSAAADPQWIQVDLGSSQSVSQVVLNWETAYAKAYQIQISADGTRWTSVYSTTTGAGGTETLTLTGTGRYVRMYGTQRATQYGYSLWEFQVYGGTAAAACGTTTAALNQPATASSTENTGTPAASAFDGNLGTRWSSAASDPQWLQVDLGSSQTICGAELSWETAYAKAYQIQISANGTSWTSVYSTTTGAGGTETLTLSGTGRYVRMYGTQRATQYGYSLWEFTILTPGGTTTPPSGGNGVCPWVGSSAPVADRVAQVMAQMTQAQKISMLHGNGNASPYIGNLSAIPSLCIPSMGFQDGPSGVGDGLGGVTQLPAAVASAATWDTGLQQQYGAVAGNEFAGKGADVALGPTLNIVRDPRWGRAFETYSEDPYLTAQMATAGIQGLQSRGVMAQAKHAAVYNQETNRNGPADNAVVDTRTLQEIYLPGFQAAVSKGAAASVMCGYSTVNGTYACQNPYLLNTALYQQAGFGGFVTSDWGAAHSTVDSANNGMTMEMPGGYFYADFLSQALANGQVSQATLNTMVSRVLTQMFAFGLFDKTKTGSTGAVVTTTAHQVTARQVAEQGSVLLKNTGVLPLSTSSVHSIAVLGADGGAGVQSVGGGSATATSSGTVSPLTGIQNRAGSGVSVQYNDASDIASAVTLARSSDVAIVFASYGEQEGTDLTSIDLPGQQNSLISQVAAANPKTIVVLNTGSAVTMPWLGQVQGVLENWYAGQEVGNAVAALLFGDVNPSGKLPVTFPASLADVPAHTTAQWPGDGSTVQYSEGLKVGYRWYDANNITPLYPFGFGLSYTTFSFSGIQVGALDASGNATVSATVTNTGSRAGAEIAQLYVADPASTGEPAKQLKGFHRVDLQPGASQSVQFTVTAHDLAHWADSAGGWTTTAGSYQIMMGDSSRNLPLTGTLTVSSTLSAKTVTTGTGSPGTTVTVTNPHGMSSLVRTAVRLPIAGHTTTAGSALTFTAAGLPAGLSISPSGVISGTATSTGTSTVSVTATDRTGATDTAGFVWTVS
ncbi:glycoside hydrolase family 3 C-terminal domain-containing protein [Actinacidiphila oryziradicis]|uniref:Exo-alpha-(1->6)-L-arabinopyranosidase n=1 Tax=Actinacidiphila oryziradicis TaxID=2571141 RepID=A0A4U0S2M1_9ACTN|nr:glycoside hydrolase family 3 C-terminal domain-containing protein [Actinacidiphila oryziradicis]TKA03116.1 beta-glucosidase [Actinacidiphila oryziradicis]